MGKIALLLLLSSLARADRVPGAIVHFQFPREECLEGSFRDSASPPLFGDLSVDASRAACTDGLGVRLRQEEQPLANNDTASSPVLKWPLDCPSCSRRDS